MHRTQRTLANMRDLARQGVQGVHTSMVLDKSFNTLPVELIVQIFVHCLPPGDTYQHVPNPFKAPLLLCQVCSTWRNIAFGVPELWDTLSLQFSGDVPSVVLNNALNIARLWFRNARDLPLHFSVDMYDADSANYFDLEFLLLSYSDQFRRLDLRIQSESDLPRFLSLSPGHFPRLEYLHFVTGALHHDGGPITAFAEAPRLKKALISVDDGWPPTTGIANRMLLPWAQLTHLEIGAGIDYIALENLFRECTFIQHVVVSFDFTNVSATSVLQGPLIMPSLVEICTTDVTHSDPSNFLLQDMDATFPALEAYEIRHCLINLDWIQAFARPLRYHALHRLSLHRNAICIDDLLFLLRATVSLVELSLWLNISKEVDHRHLWDALALTNRSDAFLLNLEVFDLWMWIYEGNFYPLECANMIKSRWYIPTGSEADSLMGYCRLRHVSIHLHPDQDRVDSMAVLLEPCKHEGLDVSVDSRQYLDSPSKKW